MSEKTDFSRATPLCSKFHDLEGQLAVAVTAIGRPHL
jgi:hypothetical protein